MKTFMLSCLIMIFLLIGCSGTENKPQITLKDRVDFTRLYGAYSLGTASPSQVDSMYAIAEKFRQLDESQNELLLQYHSTIKIPFVKHLVATELPLENVDNFHFADINIDTTKFVALSTKKDGDKDPESVAYFGIKENDKWRIKKLYRTVRVMSTLEDARVSFFQSILKSMEYFVDGTTTRNDDFWNGYVWSLVD